MVTGYLVPARDGEAEIEIKRSRFLATLRRAATEADARALVEEMRRRHWDARHHCSAFRLGPPPQPVERSSDDGEPAGTAGAPMLEVLRGAGVADVAVVVTRWFGGTLLGAGGLVRAYTEAARAALAEVGTRRRELLRSFELALPFATAGRVETDLRAAGVTVLGTTYDAAAVLHLAAPPDEEERLAALVAGLTGGTGRLVAGEDRWVDVTSGS